MMSIRDLREQLLSDHGIQSEWIESGGGQKCLLVKVGDATKDGEWLEIGSLEFDLINEYDKPVNTFAATLVVDGDTDSWGDRIPASGMSDDIAREIEQRRKDNTMSNYLVTITDYETGETFDEYVITNPDALIDLIGSPIVGKVTQ